MNTRLRQIYYDMKTRCYNTKCRQYKWYGARGIRVCQEWLNTDRVPTSDRGRPYSKGWLAFEKWSLANGYTDSLTLDRIDVNRDYSPENCRWATMKEQANNKTRGCYHITYKGQTKNLREWSKELSIPYSSLWIKMWQNDWKLEKVLKEEKK